MHSEFKNGLKYDKVGAGKVEGNMDDRKEMTAIILTGDAVCPPKNGGSG